MHRYSESSIFRRYWKVAVGDVKAFEDPESIRKKHNKFLRRLFKKIPDARKLSKQKSDEAGLLLTDFLISYIPVIQQIHALEKEHGKETVFWAKEQAATFVVSGVIGWLESGSADADRPATEGFFDRFVSEEFVAFDDAQVSSDTGRALDRGWQYNALTDEIGDETIDWLMV